MLLLQCGFANHQSAIWGERTPTPSDTASRPTAKRHAAHPFAATGDELSAALAATQTSATRDSLTVWLPTVAGSPVPSSPLLGEPREGNAELKPWLVPARVPRADSVLACLAGTGDRPTLAPGVGVGVTLQYWSAALRFAAALVARERFLPDVVRLGKEWFARWTPTISGPDIARFDRLARAMPPA